MCLTACVFLLSGCSADSVVYQIAEEGSASVQEGADGGSSRAGEKLSADTANDSSGLHSAAGKADTSSGADAAGDDGTAGNQNATDDGKASDSDGKNGQDGGSNDNDMADAKDDAGTGASGSSQADAEPSVLYVYVCGAVASPGVYQLPAGSRVYQAIEAAGGLTENAEGRCLNQAELLTDGRQVTVYTKEEAEALGLDGRQVTQQESGNTSPTAAAGAGYENAGQSDAKINLNTATKEQLMTLPGIGESRAEAILEYRTSSGGFSCIEDIQNISGIKEKAFAKIKDYIEV